MKLREYVKKYLDPWVRVSIQGLWKKPSSSVLNVKQNGRRKVFLLDLPGHGNLGDEAIAVSEVELLKKYCVQYDFDLELFDADDFVKNLKWYKKNIPEEDIILLHGGGNMGDQYSIYELIRQTVIHEFPNNKIVIFPQTYFFTDTEYGHISEKKAKKIYNSHPNLTIFARENDSFEKMKSHFNNCRIYLMPDMVINYPVTSVMSY